MMLGLIRGVDLPLVEFVSRADVPELQSHSGSHSRSKRRNLEQHKKKTFHNQTTITV